MHTQTYVDLHLLHLLVVDAGIIHGTLGGNTSHVRVIPVLLEHTHTHQLWVA